MKINCMSWQNFKGLADGRIDAQGKNVVISGRNGVGKSSIASVLTFVLFGKNSAKSFDDKGLVIDSQIPTATIEFDGLTLKRSVISHNQNRTSINGAEVKAARFDAEVLKLTNGLGIFAFNPFEFPNSHRKVQRDFLLEHFAQNKTNETVDDAQIRERIKSVKLDVAGIPSRISEIQRQLKDVPDGDIDELNAKLQTLQTEYEKLRPKDFTKQCEFLRRQISEETQRREELVEQFKNIKTACPTCGQKLPTERVSAVRDHVIRLGKMVAQRLEKLRDDLEDLQSKVGFNTELALKEKQLSNEIRELAKRIDELSRADKLRARLNELTEREKELNSRLVELEGQLVAVQQNRQSRLVASEENLNAQFKFVRFKLFKLQANGDIKDDCAAMLDGVPFQSLSKGERFKAAMDIFRTLQNKFRIEMPLFVDDAESYTPNSFVDVPNQLFLFKVTDEELRIEVSK